VSDKYLLPCRCGQQVVVEPRRAGETVACSSCGASLQVPTMLEMAALEPAPVVAAGPMAGAGWGWPHRMILLGAVCLLAAIGLGVWFYLIRPIQPIDVIDPEQIRAIANRLPPTRTWETWEAMKQGLGRSDPRYAAAVLQYQVKLGAAVVLGLVGVALIVAAAMTGRQADRQTGRQGDREAGRER
jgi:hypothetical protein